MKYNLKKKNNNQTISFFYFNFTANALTLLTSSILVAALKLTEHASARSQNEVKHSRA